MLVTLHKLADQWLRLCDRIGTIFTIIFLQMPAQTFRNLGIASILSVGAVFSASPAKAISYTFSGTSTFACSSATSFADTCQVTFSNFTADWNSSTSTWSFDDPNPLNLLTITNQTVGGDFALNTFSSSILSGSNEASVGFVNGSNQVAFTFSSDAPSSPTVPNLITLENIVVSSSDAKFNTSGLVTLSPSAQAYAAPYFASVLSVIPMFAASRRIKRRVLSA